MDAPSFDQLFRIARDEMLIRNRKLTRAVVEREGTDANAIAAAGAEVGDELGGQLVKLCSGQFLDSARGTQLDRLVFDLFGLVRKVASVARGTVTFTVASPVVTAFTVPSGTRLVSADGRQYITTATATFTVGATSAVAAIRSAAAGLSQQAQTGTINNIQDTITTAPASLAVNNTLATTGADDAEPDDDFRERARGYFSTLRRGTLEAIRQAALAVPGVRRATPVEVLDAYGRPAKAVQLIIADAYTDTLVNTVSTTYATQSQVLASDVFAALYDTRAAGIFVQVFVAQVILLTVTLALNFNADADVEDTALRARAAIVNYINGLSPGVSFTVAGALAALQFVTGLTVVGTEILSPVGTVAAGTLQVFRTNMGLVRATTLQADRALQGTTNPDSV